ncbi:hypothetical protein JCM8097_009272 [Rhodosporidiobolus ruineniae]
MRFPALLAALAASTAAAAPASSSDSFNTTGQYDLKLDGFTDAKWIAAVKKARDVVSQLTLDEKVNFTVRRDDVGGCSGLSYPIERFGIREICYSDGPTGPRFRYGTQFPAEITTGATFDRDLITARATAMAKEFRALGAHVPLAVVCGPLGRSVYGGRGWEGWGADHWLQGVATADTVEAFQKHNINANVKHFILNEQEYLRVGAPGGYGPANESQTIDSVVDAATLREQYGWPFTEAVRAGAGSIMCSYNEVNGTLACENGALINEYLKDELNFGGFALTDWGAAYNTLPTALNGTDVVQGSSGVNSAGSEAVVFGTALADAIANGTLPDTIIDDKIVRILTTYYALDQDSLPTTDFTRYVANEESYNAALDVAKGSITLLKNVRAGNEYEKRGLPLQPQIELHLAGSGASDGPFGVPTNLYTFDYTPETEYPGFIGDGFGSGTHAVPVANSPFHAITRRGQKEKRPVFVDGFFSDNAAARGTALDYHISLATSMVVFVSATASEGYDRHTLKLQLGGDELIKYVADRHNDTIVVISGPGAIDMSEWNDHPNVTSILHSYFPSASGPEAIASILFGDVSPSGKLPFTIAQNVSDYPLNLYNGTATVNPVEEFTEGPLIDYRYFDAKNITPLYEFGYGLSYSSFSFSDLKISKNSKKNPALVRETKEKFLVDGKASSGLYDYAYTVKATVKNTGSVAAAEVAQLYLTFPDSTPRQLAPRNLRGFEKPFLKAGESKTVEFALRHKDLAYYSVPHAAWVIPEGDFTVSVGSSSRKLKLTGKISV